MQLLTDKWLPSFEGRDIQRVSLREAAEIPTKQIDAVRPEFNIGNLMLAIGLSHFPDAPPVHGDGERLLQNRNALEGKELPIGTLLLNYPGESTVERNIALFNRPHSHKFCLPCATSALYVKTQFAGPGGVGYYPANAMQQALYFIQRDLFGDTVEENKCDKNIASYFMSPQDYWLGELSQSKYVCTNCGSRERTIDSYFVSRKGGAPNYLLNPHAALNENGNKFTIRPSGALINLMAGCTATRDAAHLPLALRDKEILGEEIIGFSTYYNKANLLCTTHGTFIATRDIDLDLVYSTASRVHKINSNPNVIFDQKSSYISYVQNILETELAAYIHGGGLTSWRFYIATLAAFEKTCPVPYADDLELLKRWIRFSPKISRIKRDQLIALLNENRDCLPMGDCEYKKCKSLVLAAYQRSKMPIGGDSEFINGLSWDEIFKDNPDKTAKEIADELKIKATIVRVAAKTRKIKLITGAQRRWIGIFNDHPEKNALEIAHEVGVREDQVLTMSKKLGISVRTN